MRGLKRGMMHATNSGKVIVGGGFLWREGRCSPGSGARRRARRMGGGSGDQLRGPRYGSNRRLFAPSLGAHLNRGELPDDSNALFRKQPVIARSMIGFVAIATALYLQLGLIGILYALGFELAFLLIYQLYVAVASLLDSDVY